MNTKGIRFLAVLAVMMMAFAAVFVLAPADNDTDAVNIVKNFKDAQIDPAEIGGATTTSETGFTEYYISDDMTVKVRALSSDITIYVQNGKELELDFKANPGHFITICSVTSDLEQTVVSQNANAGYPAGDTDGGKLVINNTDLKFKGEKGQTVTYKALMPISVKTEYVRTTSTSGSGAQFNTTVTTYSSKTYEQRYATISSDRSLGAPTIGSLVTIAAGQYIEVSDATYVSMNSFGIRVTDVDSSGTTITYYAPYTTASSFTMDNSEDAVLVQSGTITVKNGSSSVKANSLSYSTLTVAPTSSENGVTLNGLVSGGTVVASGDLTFSSAFAIGTASSASGVVTIANNSTVNTSTATVYGSLIVKNDNIEKLTAKGTGIIRADNIKLWNYDEPESPKVKFVDGGFSGQVDISSITETAEVKERFATANIVENQTFSVVDDTTVTTALLVEGVLIVNPGVTLTIYKLNTSGAAITMTGQYAQIINYGDIVIKTTKGSSYAPNVGLQVNGGMFLNYGRIAGTSDSTDKGPTLRVNVEKGYGFENNGTVTMSKNDAVAFSNGFTNNGSMTINSKISVASGAVKNAGSFVLNNAEVDESITIDTVSGADVSIAAILGNGEFVKVKHGDNNYVMIAAPSTLDTGTLTVRGIGITDVSTSTTALDLSGAMGVTKSATVPTSAVWYPTLTIAGSVKVTDSAIIPENYNTNTTAAKITVSGDLTLAKKASNVTDSSAGLQLTVDGGKVVSLEGDRFSECTAYTAAKYSYTSGTTIYTTFEDAVDDAIANNVATVEVGNVSDSSYVKVVDDVVIPAGMTIIGHKIAIGDSKHSPIVVLKTTAGFNIDDIKLVSGMIVAENINDVDDSAIKADVKEENEETYGVTYMSLDVALLAYAAGGVIELNQDVVITDDTLVIPAGVEINSMEDEYALVLINSDLIVNGTLATEPFYFVATVDDTKSITVNGYMIDKHEDGDCITGHWFTPIGVSYRYTEVDDYGNEETYYIITSLDNLQPAINIADDAKVTVEGNPKLGDLTITGRDDMPAEVTFNGNVNAGTLTLDDVTIIAKEGKKVTATFKNALGSITITGAYVKSKEMSIYTLDEGPVTMTGAITDGAVSTYSIIFDGITGIDGATSGAVIGWGNYVDENGDCVSYPAILFNGTTVATGKKVLIQNNIADEADRSNAGIVTITGSLIADNGNKLTIVADTEVLGGLVALEKTDEATAGNIAVEGHLFVGALMSDIYSANDALAAYHEEIGGTWTISEYGKSAHLVVDAAAILSGKISVSESCFITAMVGSLIDDAIIEDLDSLDVLIDGDVWLTVYGSSNAPYSLDGLKAPIVNAAVTEIVDADDNAVALFSQKYKVIYGSAQMPLSQYGEVFINLDYEVFAVKIKTDGSVKAVYVDGILMETGNVANIFMIYKQATGTHKVTVEPATGYTAEGCVLYTEMGTILPGMAFTFTEYDCEFVVSEDFTGYLVTYDIKGTAVEPEPVPPTPEEESQWTISTILLVILVVLIAIMAVIVALRLNRS